MAAAVLEEFQLVALGQLVPGPDHRLHVDRKAFDDLVASVREHGVLEPLLVRPLNGRFEVVAGRRRLAAAKAAQLETVPVRVKTLTDAEAAEVSIVENLQREDVHPLDEAEGYAHLLGKTRRVDDVAARVGKSLPYVAARLSLTRLLPEIRKAYADGRLEFSGARAIARLSEPGQRRVWEEFRRLPREISTDEIEEHVRREVLLALDGAPFKKADETLLPKAGPCTTCPKRTGAAPALFDDLRKGDHCTDPACFEAKLLAHIKRVIAEDPKTLLVSDSWSRGVDAKPWAGQKILSLRRYGAGDALEVGSKDRDCEHMVPAVIISGERRGHRIHACATKACQVHGRDLDRDSPSANERARRRREQLQREVERRTLEALAASIRKVAAKHKEPDWLDPGDLRALAMFAARRAEQNVEQALAKIFAIAPDKKAPFGALEAGMKKWIREAPVGEVTAFVLTAAAAADLLTLRWRGGQAHETTRAMAIRYGVNPAAIARKVTGEFKGRAQARKKTKPAATRAKPAKKSTKKRAA